MTRKRHEFSTKTKLDAFLRCNGRCERCGARLRPGQYRYDHDKTDWMGGDHSLQNCVVACLACDAPKTANDQRVIAKTKRQMVRHVGARASSRPLPGGKRSPISKKVSGAVVPRKSQSEKHRDCMDGRRF